MKQRILVIDDDGAILQSCQTILEDAGYEVEVADGGDAGLHLLRQKSFDLALIDLRLPKMNGLEVLRHALELDADLVAIIFTAYGSIESAVEAIKKGAFNYISKPFTASQITAAVEKALEHRTLLHENLVLRRQLENCCPLHQMVGRSRALQPVWTAMAKVAPTEANVLVEGESGTGKELIARSLHANSNRRTGPFIAVDCAALPSNLLESELFGHERGAFTSAHAAKRGLLELANGGTAFFDEIGEMSLELQSKLLRTLEERSFRRLGGERLINVDIRIISSTNRALESEVEHSRFRRDLFYRLNVVTIHLPPLRDRYGDVRLLVGHFLDTFSRATGKACLRVAPEALQALEQYEWPGNVRELRNVVERAVVFCEAPVVRLADLPEHIRQQVATGQREPGPTGYKAAREQWLERQGKQYLTALLRRHRGNISAAAREAEISRGSLYELMRKFEVDRRDVECEEPVPSPPPVRPSSQ